jgi:hypothetical protein
MPIFFWIKKNKLSTLLLVLLVYGFGRQIAGTFFGIGSMSDAMQSTRPFIATDQLLGSPAFEKSMDSTYPSADYAPVEAETRLVVRDTSLSLVVNQVPEALFQIESLATKEGGFLVNSNLSIPESAANGTITIRIPESRRVAVLQSIKAMGIKTVSENTNGHDVTDQYVDNEARLETLVVIKSKLETMLEQAVRMQDMLEIQRELINLQSQIDRLKGSQLYLEQTAKLARITIHLSTDEYALPYTPAESWRPEVIFKQAVRSLVSHGRSLATTLIWLIVYSPIWLTALIVWWLVKHRQSKSTIQSG